MKFKDFQVVLQDFKLLVKARIRFQDFHSRYKPFVLGARKIHRFFFAKLNWWKYYNRVCNFSELK